MKEDKEFGTFWELIFEEYKLTRALLLEVSDFKSLMEMNPLEKLPFVQERKLYNHY